MKHFLMAILIGILLVLNYCTAQAAELTKDQVVVIYAVAYGDMRFIPEKAPTVRVTTQEVLREVCRCGYPNVKGAYLDGTVYIDQGLDFGEPLSVSILYHELIHYIQAQKSGPTHGCEMSMEREREAYGLQTTFLWKYFQVRFHPPALPMCL
jgi:prolipoprotein diacylglyceryltransferase